MENDTNSSLSGVVARRYVREMRGLGFMRTLAAVSDGAVIGEFSYEEILAGLLVSGVADYSRRLGRLDHQASAFARRAAKCVADIPSRTSLLAILSACPPGTAGYPDALDGALVSYGCLLHSGGVFDAAADVFAIVAEAADAAPDTLLLAMYRRAFAIRMLRRYDEAEMAYAVLERHAKRFCNTHMQLEAELGRAKLETHRGNHPAAQAELAKLISEAAAVGDSAIVAKARIDLSYIAGVRGEPSLVIRYAHAALADLTSRISRDRAIQNMAVAYRELGRPDMAGMLAGYLLRLAEELEQRVVAATLLYHLALDRGDFDSAETMRSRLSQFRLAPVPAFELYEAEARHLALMGDFRGAAAAVGKMISVAERNRLSEFVIRADRSMDDVKNGRVPVLYTYAPAPAESSDKSTAEIDADLSELCRDSLGGRDYVSELSVQT